MQDWNRPPEGAPGGVRSGRAALWPSTGPGEDLGSPKGASSPQGLLSSPRRRGGSAGGAGADSSMEGFVKERLGSLLEELAALGGGRLDRAEFDALGLVLAEEGAPPVPEPPAALSEAAGAPPLPAEPGTVLKWVQARLQALDVGEPPAEGPGGVVRVVGVRHSTGMRSAGSGSLSQRVVVADCHGAAVYCLLPADYCLVQGCSDCTIVVGAVGRCLRVEGCSRVTVIAACGRAVLSSCHDSVFHLGVNSPPLLLGDGRNVQLAPFNTAYDGLEGHLRQAGVSAATNLWDSPEAPGAAGGSAGGSPPEVAAAFHCLPPGSFAPFVVPFKGPGSGAGEEADKSAKNPFNLPGEYAAAVKAKVSAVKELRAALKGANLEEGAQAELQSCIQSHFKEWLAASGNLRQIYDLALMEPEGPIERSAE